MTIANKKLTASDTGTISERALVPARARTSKTSCVAYDMEDRASDAKTGRAIVFGSSVWWSSPEPIGLPTKTRLSASPTVPNGCLSVLGPGHQFVLGIEDH